jgi:hypothetical protein
MKKLIAFLIATPIVWAILIGLIGIPFVKMLASLTLDGTPLFIHTEQEAATVVRWTLGITGLVAVRFGIEISAIIADWDRLIQRLFMPGRRRWY